METDISRESLLNAIDAEIQQANHSTNLHGLSTWPILVSVGVLSLFVADRWQGPDWSVDQIILVFLGCTLALDGLLKFLTRPELEGTFEGSHGRPLPLIVAENPPGIALLHRALLLASVVMVRHDVGPIVTVIASVQQILFMTVVFLNVLFATAKPKDLARFYSRFRKYESFEWGIRIREALRNHLSPIISILLIKRCRALTNDLAGASPPPPGTRAHSVTTSQVGVG